MGRVSRLGPVNLVSAGAAAFGVIDEVEFVLNAGMIVRSVAVFPNDVDYVPAIVNVILTPKEKYDEYGDDTGVWSIPLIVNEIIWSDTFRTKQAVWNGELELPEDSQYVLQIQVHHGGANAATDVFRAIAVVESD